MFKIFRVELSINKSLYISGPNLPLKLWRPTMVTSPTGKGVIIMGGGTNSQECSKAMFELSESMEWTRLKQTLKIDHGHPLPIPIPYDLVEIVKTKKKLSKNERDKKLPKFTLKNG